MCGIPLHGAGLRRSAAALCLVCAVALAADPPSLGEIGDLVNEYQKLANDYTTSLPEGAAIDWAKHPATAYRPRFRALAEKYAGQGQSIMALNWLVSNADQAPPGAGLPDAQWALDQIESKFIDSPVIRGTLRSLRYSVDTLGEPAVLKFFDAAIAQNKDRETLGSALCFKAAVLLETADDPRNAKEADARRKDAVTLLRRVQKDFTGTDAATTANGLIYEVEHLQVGMVAPDFAGKDADGKEIRLSQYKGRVLVVDFWGHW